MPLPIEQKSRIVQLPPNQVCSKMEQSCEWLWSDGSSQRPSLFKPLTANSVAIAHPRLGTSSHQIAKKPITNSS